MKKHIGLAIVASPICCNIFTLNLRNLYLNIVQNFVFFLYICNKSTTQAYGKI